MTDAGEAISILVADDHEDTLSALVKLLRISGYTVYAARTLSEASALASDCPCDLLVGDIQLPDGSGLDLMRDLQARYGLQGIAVTGYTDKHVVEAALKAGFCRYLTKPVTFPDLLAAVQELTGGCLAARAGGHGPARQEGEPLVPAG